jgi:predicted transcriptional regulator
VGRPRKKKRFTGISDAELEVLQALWAKGPDTPQGLQERLSGQGTDWAYTTVQTLLHRLLRKGYVARTREGVAQVYRASVDREDVLAAHLDDLARRMCAGAASPLLLSLVRSKRFSRAELARFREILDESAPAKPGGSDKARKRE